MRRSRGGGDGVRRWYDEVCVCMWAVVVGVMTREAWNQWMRAMNGNTVGAVRRYRVMTMNAVEHVAERGAHGNLTEGRAAELEDQWEIATVLADRTAEAMCKAREANAAVIVMSQTQTKPWEVGMGGAH